MFGKPHTPEVLISGFSEKVSQTEKALCRSRIANAVTKFLLATGETTLKLSVSAGNADEKSLAAERADQTGKTFIPAEPAYSFKQLVLPEKTLQEIENAVRLIEVRPLLFQEWGLSEIESHPRTALNFYGPPGTGKTMAAHALAERIGKKIIIASYADIESKYVGDGPKNVQTLFAAAEKEQAVLFIDEADSLLSKRLTNVASGAESALNSMRSQLLICLEHFEGIVIFATNLVENYDHAFESRLRYVQFDLPDRGLLRRLWQIHLVRRLPLEKPAEQMAEELSAMEGLCGRDVRNAVIDAALAAALRWKDHPEERPAVTTAMLKAAAERAQKQHRTARKPEGRPLGDEEKQRLSAQIKQHLTVKTSEEKGSEKIS